ncbi:DUF1853 family protein [Neisseria sicca]|uniref:DUF1853 family protein n=1 Tax=Neisseria sicca TaxID=490 RepID=UPI00195B970D|nr:DUF1853 family protein [Neisseria sicca]VTX49486.1 Uncharacterised protein [Neisseria sicca]
MNYALDALWWKLATPSVRDLATLLTAPPLWQSGCELSVRELLGERGFRYLLDLDGNPAPLNDYLAEHAPFGNRLGIYAEHLLAFWFTHAPHTELHAYNLPVFSDDLTQGAADFIASINGKPYHIELTCKYYGSDSGKSAEMHGLNAKDTLATKAAKLPRQLALFQSSNGSETLRQNRLPDAPQPTSIIRGIGFFSIGADSAEAPLNPYCWRGVFIRDWSTYPTHDGSRYHLIDRMAYLAPARVTEAQTLSDRDVRQIESGLIAKLELRPDGFWHEIERIMKVA